MTIYDDVSAKIIGRVAIQKAEADYLEKLYSDCRGLHVEIGTLWGGTAIHAALAKPAGMVVTIDYMKLGYWDDGDPDVPGEKLSKGVIFANFDAFMVSDKIKVIEASSFPLPLDFDLIPETVFIDAGHDRSEVLQDWESVKDITQKYVIFHDYGRLQGVTDAVDSIKDKNWKLKEVFETLAIFERVPVVAEKVATKKRKKNK
jgi:hypothetical protein